LKTWILSLAISAFSLSSAAEMLPGFRMEKLVSSSGFVSSLAVDHDDRIYYSTTAGGVFRLEGDSSVRVATIDTANEGNAALLGIAFTSPTQLIVHYVLPDLTADAIATVDLESGEQALVETFPCDPPRPCPTEHHGGNLTVTEEGTIFFGIGDYGLNSVAQLPGWFGGRIFRISRLGQEDEAIEEFALGLRNPFDMVWHEERGHLIVADNGPEGGDEIHVVRMGDNLGWPYTVGFEPPFEGAVPPIYTFDETIAPTGVWLVRGPLPMPQGGLLVGSFVTKALYYFPDIDERPLRDPITILSDETPVGIIDVVQDSTGAIFVASGLAVYRLHLPLPGDADGNGQVDSADLAALLSEINDGDGTRTVDAQEGAFRGSWGADVNLDGFIDERDLTLLAKMIPHRRRPARVDGSGTDAVTSPASRGRPASIR
jgi:glucose/arabinose dehydrogenase